MNLLENLDIQTQSVTASKCVITVKVSDKLKQPYGIVHGGVNAILAETAASLGANQWLADHHQDKIALGVNLTTEHLIAVSSGYLKAIATPIKRGHSIQTWQANIYCNQQQTSTSIVTLINRPHP
ncbi:PaaI family thioesterase [Limosilactobacillus sp. STM2_1]|uniref:PaaI family thioesterase n=1 Tax=Limosilactobacillus rudii TaxID=2759755 RepID=A0A7W3UL08_9LACO|nr:PaaI family thioesterase [Limosilactobacillus rudii]MBB1079140.1 PaaI family thioesterase [Limosilactobacillus rudii]MBB1096985.1 PaaI family thioesterase [Limosilactobacillus rudii]MCD7133953.1 PaaI family thioesterase [Limosilactobacillus rudii]